MDYKGIIKDAATEHDLFVKETGRSLILKCPNCGKEKLYFDKTQGNYICFAGGCANKGLTIKLLSQIKNISYAAAKDLIFSHDKVRNSYALNWQDGALPDAADVTAIEMPISIVSIADPSAADGVEYLKGRGLDLNTAIKYGIMYHVIQERVVFVIRNSRGEPVGYQARAIHPVDKANRMRNNPNFKKGQFLMFFDKAESCDHLIIGEGPVDALKFDLCGGNVATMGKELSSDQLNIIDRSRATKVYWALDEDADNLIPKYASLINKESFLVRVPESAKVRILASGKDKVDFGECTMEECKQAFEMAEPVAGKILW